jgi:CHAT domain-containing protein
MEGATLSNLGNLYGLAGQPETAIEALQQALAIQKELEDRRGQVFSLANLGSAYIALKQFEAATATYQAALPIQRQLQDRVGEAYSLYTLGRIQADLEQYAAAIEFYQQALVIQQELNQPAAVAESLIHISNAHLTLGQYSQALANYQQALQIVQGFDRPLETAKILNNLGITYRFLGQFESALDFHQQAIVLYQTASPLPLAQQLNEVSSFIGLGNAYASLKDYPQAIAAYQQALAGSQALQATFPLESRQKASNALVGLGAVYGIQAQYQEAIAVFQQALDIAREQGNRASQANALVNLGNAHRSLDKLDEAFEFYRQAVVIQQELGDREGEGVLFSNLALLLADQEQPDLAIVFFKQSVNIRESIRYQLQDLEQALQQSYVTILSDNYRQLAALLLLQGRISEAQQVLDLLKVQELAEYLQDVQGNTETAKGIAQWEPEQQILNLFQQSIQDPVQASSRNFWENPAVMNQLERLKQTVTARNLNDQELTQLQEELKTLPNTVLFYPLILEDRLELILIKPDREPIRRTVFIDRNQFAQAIVDFRTQLTNPLNRSPQATAQRLYRLLIQPLDDELEGTETLLYAADGQLRYVPLSALHDGQQWLIQRFNINSITAASLTNFSTPQTRSMRVLAAAFSEGSAQFQAGGREFDFAGLPNARTEVQNIATQITDTTEFFNQAFSPSTILPQMDQYSIIHFATHAEFVSGAPEESFILFGNGDRISLRDIASWQLSNVDLVVLSACKTAVGGKLGNGQEILGLGYQMQRTGARATIASLWSVDDGGTQVLMTLFYAALSRSGTPIAEALRQAQIALITGEMGDLEIPAEMQLELSPYFSRPYYWAPFLIIGNGVS